MRVKVKGFEVGKSYNLFNEHDYSLLDMHVFFSKKHYVLVSYYDQQLNVEKKYAASKRYFKKFIRELPFSIRKEEMYNYDFFKEYYNRFEDYSQDDDYDSDWSMDYACENGCCSCCGCSCNDYLYYDYDDEEEYSNEEKE